MRKRAIPPGARDLMPGFREMYTFMISCLRIQDTKNITIAPTKNTFVSTRTAGPVSRPTRGLTM